MKDTLQINNGHTVEIDENADSSKMELAFMHVHNRSIVYTVYNDICECCKHIKRQVAQLKTANN